MMRFLFKIYSGYDKFTPRRLPERLDERGYLRLGWLHYLDVVERGAEVWVYFKGPHRFEPGVYVKGLVVNIDRVESVVWLKPREYATDSPLDVAGHEGTIADAVGQRFRQVFFLPDAVLPAPPACVPAACASRRCERCPRWQRMPLIHDASFASPYRLADGPLFVPAYWVIPPRCYFHQERRPISRLVQETSNFFYGFKTGDPWRAYPLALGIYRRLASLGAVEYDAIVPIPLSPEKIARGDLHRTQALAQELARLLRAEVAEVLELSEPLSKRNFKAAGGTEAQFEREYFRILRAGPLAGRIRRVLLIDDVCTEGATLRASWRRLLNSNPTMTGTIATAGQMILKSVVRDETTLRAA